MLAVVPSLAEVGGVQVAARLAWECVARRCDRTSRKAYLFCYGRAAGPGTGIDSEVVVHARCQLSAVLRAAGRRWPVRSVLVWHLGLVKLLPFFRLGGARIAVFLHGIEAWGRLDPLTRRLLRRVSIFFSISDYTWQRFLRLNPEWSGSQSRTIHLGVGSPVGRSLPPPDEPPAVLMIGRLLRGEDYKGHREVIAAWPRVLSRVRDAELWIAGDGDLRPELEASARALVDSGKVRFFGVVSEGQKQALLARCRCLAMPSRAEGFGLAYLEAMRVGRPCLVSTVDAGPEVVNPPEAGLAVNPGDLGGLADGLCRLLSAGGDWTRWSEQARHRYEGGFTAAHFQGRLEVALADAGLLDA